MEVAAKSNRIMNFEAKCELLREMIESLQCTKCKAVPGFEYESRVRFQCLNNPKVLCKLCMNECDCVCESCQNADSTPNPTPSPVIEKLLKNLPCFCPNYSHGCREIFANCESLKEHKISCIFRLVPCIIDDGCADVKFLDYRLHLTNQHVFNKNPPVKVNSKKFEVILNYSHEEDKHEIWIENDTYNLSELNGK